MLQTAIEAAKKGGEVLLRYFETELQHEVKNDTTFVTKADRESEAVILSILKKKYPKHSYLAEESGELQGNSLYAWVIDPLDGTANFVNGLPLWAISIAFLHNGRVMGAVVYNPLLEFLIHAERGKGLFCNGVQRKVSTQGKEAAMISVGVGKGSEIKSKLISLLREAPNYVKTYRYVGTAALELALLARGGTEGFVCLGNSKWDYAAGTLLVEEAGGKITDLRGNPWHLNENFFVASNGVVHDDLLHLLNAAGLP